LKELLEVEIGNLLRKKNMKLVISESCTGGLIGHRITNVPGSSDYYLGSITAYAYEAKETLLGVKHETLMKYGAVSRQTVIEWHEAPGWHWRVLSTGAADRYFSERHRRSWRGDTR